MGQFKIEDGNGGSSRQPKLTQAAGNGHGNGNGNGKKTLPRPLASAPVAAGAKDGGFEEF
jgi:hypothetical protein